MFDEKIATPLCEIMGRNGSDKGSQDIENSWHNFTTFYYSIFKDLKPLRVFELGIGSNNAAVPSNMIFMGAKCRPGASLYGWSEFFPTALVCGADIDRDILFETESIKTFYCDQQDPAAIRALWENPILKDQFDIIIEDGLHNFEANVCFFENSIQKLAIGGYYIMEDISVHSTIPRLSAKISEWKTQYPHLSFRILSIPSIRNPNNDNNLLVVHYEKSNQ